MIACVWVIVTRLQEALRLLRLLWTERYRCNVWIGSVTSWLGDHGVHKLHLSSLVISSRLWVLLLKKPCRLRVNIGQVASVLLPHWVSKEINLPKLLILRGLLIWRLLEGLWLLSSWGRRCIIEQRICIALLKLPLPKLLLLLTQFNGLCQVIIDIGQLVGILALVLLSLVFACFDCKPVF